MGREKGVLGGDTHDCNIMKRGKRMFRLPNRSIAASTREQYDGTARMKFTEKDSEGFRLPSQSFALRLEQRVQ